MRPGVVPLGAAAAVGTGLVVRGPAGGRCRMVPLAGASEEFGFDDNYDLDAEDSSRPGYHDQADATVGGRNPILDLSLNGSASYSRSSTAPLLGRRQIPGGDGDAAGPALHCDSSRRRPRHDAGRPQGERQRRPGGRAAADLRRRSLLRPPADAARPDRPGSRLASRTYPARASDDEPSSTTTTGAAGSAGCAIAPGGWQPGPACPPAISRPRLSGRPRWARRST